jgi:hypothetical protein
MSKVRRDDALEFDVGANPGRRRFRWFRLPWGVCLSVDTSRLGFGCEIGKNRSTLTICAVFAVFELTVAYLLPDDSPIKDQG